MIYERMADYVDALGSVQLNQPVRRVLHENKKVTGIELANGSTWEYDHVISTMPLTSLIKGLDDTPEQVTQAADELSFRNTVLVYLNVDSTELFEDQWIYVHSDDLQVGRITNFRNWIPQLYGKSKTSILSLEYWCNSDEPMWEETDEQLIERAKTEMRATGLIGDAPILDGHVVRVPRCYPVYATGYKKPLSVLSDYVQEFSGLTPIGRYGSFKYNNQDHSILMGLLAADNLLQQRENDLWSINTDYETYQEAATITASGLVTTAS